MAIGLANLVSKVIFSHQRVIWTLGFSPFDQFNKIIEYAAKCKKDNIGFISIDNDYGRKIYDST